MTGEWLLALTYLAAVVFIGGVSYKAVKYARAPFHLRWELYPIPHEKGRAEYGGSYLEEVDWWKHPRQTSLVGEILAMLEEILLIRSLWHRNRAQWYASFPFHAGLYLLIGFVALLLFGAILEAVGIAAGMGPLWGALEGLTIAVGVIGLAAATAGCLGLLWRRITDSDLKAASTVADYLNLALLLAVLLSAGYAWLSADPTFGLLRGYLRGFLTFSPAAANPAVVVEVVLVSLLMIYMPFTHMTHFVAKYFTYHQVRWDDAPSVDDPRIAAKVKVNLARPVGWAGPHINSEKSWAETATEVK